MRTRTLTMSLAAAATLVLSSCGSDSSGQDTEGLTGDGTGASCKLDAPVPVGAAFSLTGAGAGYGESQKNGIELAAAELSNSGITYDLTVEDDQTDPRQAISVFEGFVNDGVSIIVGPTLSTNALQAHPIAQDEGVPVLAVSNTAEGITEQGDYIFRNSLTEAQVIPQTVAASHEAFGYEKVVVMYANDDALADSGYQAFDGALNEAGIEVLETLTFSKADTDFRSLLTQVKDADPDALIVSSLIESAIPITVQARELGIDIPIIGGNGFNTPQFMADAGEAAEGVVVGAAWNSSSDLPENTEFLKAYEAEYAATPDQFAAQAYAGMKLIDEAVRANCSAVRDDIRDGLAGISGVPTVLGEFSIDENRDAAHEAVVQIVKDGSFEVLED